MLKNKKVVTEKIVKSRNKKYAKNNRFLPQMADFCKTKKQPCASLTFETEKLYTKFYQNPLSRFSEIALRMDGLTHGRTNAQTLTDLISPPEKFSGDKFMVHKCKHI